MGCTGLALEGAIIARVTGGEYPPLPGRGARGLGEGYAGSSATTASTMDLTFIVPKSCGGMT